MDGSINSAEMSMFMHFNQNKFVDNVTVFKICLFLVEGDSSTPISH